MANEVIGIDIKVSLEQLKQQLATLGPGMQKEAAAMTAELNKQLKAQVAATKAATAQMAAAQRSGMKQAGEAAGAAATKFDKLGMAMGPLGGVLSRISPEAGAAASSIAGVTSSVQGLAAAGVALQTLVPIVLAVSTAVAAGAVAWDIYTSAAEAAAKRAQKQADGLKVVTKWELELKKAQYDLKEATGTLTFEEEKAAMAREVNGRATEDAIGRTEEEKSALLSLSSKVRYAKEQEIEYRRAMEESAEVTARRAKATAAAEKATAAAAKATAEAVAAEQKTNADAAAEAMAVTKMVEKNRDVATKRQLARLEEEEEAEKRARAYITKLVQGNLDEQEKAAAESAAFIQSVADESTTALDRLLGAMHQFASLAADEAAEAAEKAADRLSNIRGLLAELTAEQVDASTLTGDALVKAYKRGEVGVEDLTDTQKASVLAVLSAQEDAAAKRARSERKAAKKAWDMQQALSIGQTFAAGAVALIKAVAELGPVAGGIAAVGIAAATAASIATITSQKPSFHSGGVVGGSANGQGEVSARLLPGEALLNRQATNALGPSGVAALNSGASMGAVSLRIGRLEAREIVRTDVAAGGLIVRTAKSAAASAGNTAGRTGRRPIA